MSLLTSNLWFVLQYSFILHSVLINSLFIFFLQGKSLAIISDVGGNLRRTGVFIQYLIKGHYFVLMKIVINTHRINIYCFYTFLKNAIFKSKIHPTIKIIYFIILIPICISIHFIFSPKSNIFFILFTSVFVIYILSFIV